jgi:hypothetical protein
MTEEICPAPQYDDAPGIQVLEGKSLSLGGWRANVSPDSARIDRP